MNRGRVKYVLVPLFAAITLHAQFYNLPQDYFFSLLTERVIADRSDSVHSAIKPYIPFFSSRYRFVGDDHRVFKFIQDDPGVDVVFNNHLISVRSKPDEQFYRLRLDPYILLETGADNVSAYNGRLYTNGRGFVGSGEIGKDFYFETSFVESQSMLTPYIANYALATQVVPGQARWKTFKINGFDYAFANGFFSVQVGRHLNVQAGQGKQKIGYGYRSLLLSDNSSSYPFARFTQSWFSGRIQYTNIYAQLTNLVPAAKVPTPNTERLFQRKAAAFQYLSINPSRWLNIGLFQGVISAPGDYRNVQHLGLSYANPVIFSQLAAQGFNGSSNVLVGGDLRVKITNRTSVYGQFMADRGSADSAGFAGGVQCGLLLFDVMRVKNLFLQLEYNRVDADAYTYRGRMLTDQSYSNYNQALAFTPGNGQEFIILADYRKRRLFANMHYHYQVVNEKRSLENYVNLMQFKFGYVINSSYNLHVYAGFTHRKQNFFNFRALSGETNYVFIGIRTSLSNLYSDF